MRWTAVLFGAGFIAGCSTLSTPECASSTQCTFQAGGQCKADPTGQSWCQYPDATCPAGIRWSSEAGNDLASACVAPYEMLVSKQGTGGGTVTSDPAGVNCGSSCSATYADGMRITLTAMPDGSSTFSTWTGDASSCGTTTVRSLTITKATNAVAVFDVQAETWVTPWTGDMGYRR